MASDAVPPIGFWRVDFVFEGMHRRYCARRYLREHEPPQEASAAFHTLPAAYAWLIARGCRQDALDPNLWRD